MSTRKQAAAPPLPEELFHAIAALVNRLIHISEEECGVQPIQLLILWHIRHFGKANNDKEPVILRQELTRMLKGNFRYSDTDISKLLAELQEGGFIVRTAVSRQERLALFLSKNGDTRVVILKHSGDEKIEQFKEQLRSRVDHWLSKQPRATRLAIVTVRPIVEKFARWLVQHFEPEREKILYPEKQVD